MFAIDKDCNIAFFMGRQLQSFVSKVIQFNTCFLLVVMQTINCLHKLFICRTLHAAFLCFFKHDIGFALSCSLCPVFLHTLLARLQHYSIMRRHGRCAACTRATPCNSQFAPVHATPAR